MRKRTFVMLICMVMTIYGRLTAQTRIVLDGSLEQSEPSKGIYNEAGAAFEAINHTSDAVLEVWPGVYWLDDPDDPEVRLGKNGDVPYGATLRCERLRILGKGGAPSDIVFAVNRGQTQGAIGNYTMIHFIGKEVSAENVTFGNFCNVDLNYPKDPAKSRKARSKTIVQAQIAICQGTETVRMQKCRFISRLNLCPFVGASRAYFNDCHFECTDDALNGSAFYEHCTFTFFSSKPFYSTAATGAVFHDCDITTHVRGTQYLTKAGGTVTMVNTRWHSDSDSLQIEWSKDDEPYYTCYASDVTLNGKPVQIDKGRPWRTVDCSDPWHRYLFVEPARTFAYPAVGRDLVIQTRECAWGEHPHSSQPRYERTYHKENSSYKRVHDTIMVERDGMRAIACVHIDGRHYPAPSFTKRPKLKKKKDRLRVSYKLGEDLAPTDPEGNQDHSLITWYKVRDDGTTVAIRQGHAGEVQGIEEMEVYGPDAFVSVVPKYRDSQPGWDDESRAYLDVSHYSPRVEERIVESSFSDVPLIYAERLTDTGVWLMDTHKPADTSAYSWKAEKAHAPWTYGTSVDGAKGKGLVTVSRGARLIYTPAFEPGNRLELDLWADPCKTGGQGFGSATGQYFDVGIGFDLTTLSGYAVRIERTPAHDNAVEFSIVKYDHGQTTVVSERKASRCFRTGFHLHLTLADGKLTATGERDGDRVEIETDADICGKSIYMQHTGTCGASALMLHKVKMFF